MLTCPNTKCGYKWQPRVPRPKVCPKCHRFLTEEDWGAWEGATWLDSTAINPSEYMREDRL